MTLQHSSVCFFLFQRLARHYHHVIDLSTIDDFFTFACFFLLSVPIRSYYSI